MSSGRASSGRARGAVLAIAVASGACSGSAHHAASRTAAGQATTSTVPADCVSRPDEAGPPAGFLVTAANLTFTPTCVRTIAGRLDLVFNNRDAGVGHSLTVFDPTGAKVISSGVLTGPRVYTLDFAVSPGVYRYRCDVHPQLMHGIIVVR